MPAGPVARGFLLSAARDRARRIGMLVLVVVDVFTPRARARRARLGGARRARRHGRWR